MSLTTGKGPLSAQPAGRFTAPVPEGVTYIEPFRRRVRGIKEGRTVVDSERVLLVHRQSMPPAYAFPREDVDGVDASDEADIPGYVSVDWDDVDIWSEENERVLGHPRNPYHRIDCLRAERWLRVEAKGTVLVDTHDTLVVYETALDPRLYVDRRHVRMDLLEPSSNETYCPYKGTCSYWNARIGGEVLADVAWSYEDPLPESLPLAGFLSFDASRVTLREDLPPAS